MNKIDNYINSLEEKSLSLYEKSLIKKGYQYSENMHRIREKIRLFKYVSRRKINTDVILKKVSNEFCIPISSIHLRTRKREIVEPRQIAHYLARKYTMLSCEDIGEKIGGVDHATVLHSCKTVNNLIDTDKHFRNKINKIETKL